MTTTAEPSLGYVAVFWLCRVPPTQMLILERTPPRRPYGRNFDLEMGLGSIVAYEAEYGPRMTTTARPSLGRRRGTLFLSRGFGGRLGGGELGGGLAARRWRRVRIARNSHNLNAVGKTIPQRSTMMVAAPGGGQHCSSPHAWGCTGQQTYISKRKREKKEC